MGNAVERITITPVRDRITPGPVRRCGSKNYAQRGSRLFGGRWNPKNNAVFYTTSTPELGLVETLAHAPAIRYEELPTYWVFTIEVPDDVRYYRRDELPDYWQDETYERTQQWLRPWLAQPDQLSVAVPSVLVPLSYNVILNPAHELFGQIRVVAQEIQSVDRRLWERN